MTKAATSKVRCPCPGSEPGKLNTDPMAHVIGCWVRKKLLTKRFMIDTTVIPGRWNDGFDTGVVWQ